MKRLLVVSHNNNLIQKVVKLFSSESVEIVYVHTLSEAIQQIVNDGFDLTLIDYQMNKKYPNGAYELTELSVVAGKVTVLVADDSTNRLGIMDKVSKDVYLLSNGSSIFNDVLKSYLELPKKSKDDIFKDIYQNIQKIKKESFFCKYKKLSFI